MIHCLTCTASTDNMRTLSGEYWAWVSALGDPERTGAMCPRCLREKIKRENLTTERERNLARMQENRAKGRALGDNEGEER